MHRNLLFGISGDRFTTTTTAFIIDVTFQQHYHHYQHHHHYAVRSVTHAVARVGHVPFPGRQCRSFHTTGRLILVRHGQSIWNHGTEFGARFTGWANVPLTELGVEQAYEAGRALRRLDIPIHCAVTSLLQRARKTMQCILQELQYLEDNVVVVDDPHQQQHHQQQQQQQQQQQPLEYTNHHTSTIPHTSHSNHQLPDDPLKQLNGSNWLRTLTSSTSNSSMSSKDLIASFIHDDPHIMLEHHCVCKIPILASWRLNERSYGALVGMSKSGAEEYYGKAQLDPWRHGWDVRPPPMPDDVVQDWSQRHPHCRMVTIIQTPQTIPTPSPQQHHGIPTSSTRVASTVQVMEKGLPWHGSVPIMPASESLADTCHRVLPLWEWGIAPRLLRGENVLLVAHANTVKAMLRLLDPHIVTPDGFSRLKIPNTTPLVYQFQPASPYDDDMIPGGLAVVPPPPCLDWNETRPTNNVTPPSQSSPQAIPSTEELRYHLRAQWLG